MSWTFVIVSVAIYRDTKMFAASDGSTQRADNVKADLFRKLSSAFGHKYVPRCSPNDDVLDNFVNYAWHVWCGRTSLDIAAVQGKRSKVKRSAQKINKHQCKKAEKA